MNDFFHGWRRKAGVVALGLACVVTMLWIRSLWMVDLLDFRPTRLRQLSVASGSGAARPSFSWITEGSLEGQPLLEWIAYEDQHKDGNYLPTLFFGSWGQVGSAIPASVHAESVGLYIPYWFLVLPITLLSTYLLLWKPRKRDSAPTRR